jgi:hypothetical protein
MAPLQNSAIESPERLFQVEFVVTGMAQRLSAVTRTIQVLAQTAKGARRICKARYRHSEIKSAREASPTSDPCLV